MMIAKSPRERAGLPRYARTGLTNSTQWGASPWRPGMRVRPTADPRHEGEVVAVLSGLVRVLWDNGWRQDFQGGKGLERAP